jgi:hypothetical protein
LAKVLGYYIAYLRNKGNFKGKNHVIFNVGNTYAQIYLREEKVLCEVKGVTTY